MSLDGILTQLGPVRYRCTEGVLYVKRSEDPREQRIVQLSRPIGSHIVSTGLCWRGGEGGLWTEFDAAKGDFGWVLVEGQGFDLRGPALTEVMPPLTLTVKHMGDTEATNVLVFDGSVEYEAEIKDVKNRICKTTGLKRHLICFKRPDAGDDDIPLDLNFFSKTEEQIALVDDSSEVVDLDMPRPLDPIAEKLRTAMEKKSTVKILQDDCAVASLTTGDNVELFITYLGNFAQDWKAAPTASTAPTALTAPTAPTVASIVDDDSSDSSDFEFPAPPVPKYRISF